MYIPNSTFYAKKNWPQSTFKIDYWDGLSLDNDLIVICVKSLSLTKKRLDFPNNVLIL